MRILTFDKLENEQPGVNVGSHVLEEVWSGNLEEWIMRDWFWFFRKETYAEVQRVVIAEAAVEEALGVVGLQKVFVYLYFGFGIVIVKVTHALDSPQELLLGSLLALSLDEALELCESCDDFTL